MFSKHVRGVGVPFGSSLILVSMLAVGSALLMDDVSTPPQQNSAASALATSTFAATTSTSSIPSTPERFSIMGSKGKAALLWSMATGTVVEYKITRYEPKSDLEILLTVASTTLGITDTGLHKGRTYWYSLYACNRFGCSYPTSLSVLIK